MKFYAQILRGLDIIGLGSESANISLGGPLDALRARLGHNTMGATRLESLNKRKIAIHSLLLFL